MDDDDPRRALDPVRGSAPGTIGFHGDAYLLRLVAYLAGRSEVFVETGANLGTTVGFVARTFPTLRCLSCEPDAAAFEVAREHLADQPQVAVFNETSQDFMARLATIGASLFELPTLFWLDAHGYGFDWPLRDELRFVAERFNEGFVLIDDFLVPGKPQFGYDRYEQHVCSWDYVADAAPRGWRHRLYYPAYTEHTSPHHPLRGWGLIQFGGGPLHRLDAEPELAGVLELARPTVSSRSSTSSLSASSAPAQPATAPRAPDSSSLLGSSARRPTADVPSRAPARAPGPSGFDVARDRFDDLRALLDRDDPVVVDGGANRGAVVGEVLARWPRARVHAVEAQPALARELARTWAGDPRVTVHAAALARETGTLEFHVTANSVSSSPLVPTAFKRSLHGANVDVTETLTVSARRLAELVPERIDLLKLDVQGFEIEALAGLGERLEDVGAILTEVQFAPLYEGTPLFGDVDRFLRSAGFALFNLYELWTTDDGRLTAGDAVYLNARVFDVEGAGA